MNLLEDTENITERYQKRFLDLVHIEKPKNLKIAELIHEFMLEKCVELNIPIMNNVVVAQSRLFKDGLPLSPILLDDDKNNLVNLIRGLNFPNNEIIVKTAATEARNLGIKVEQHLNDFQTLDPFKTLEGLLEYVDLEYFLYYKTSVNDSGEVIIRYSNSDMDGNYIKNSIL